MEKNKTLAEVYKNSSDEVKEILKNKFSNEELGIKFIPKNGDICISNYGTIFISNGNTYNSLYYSTHCILLYTNTLDLTAQKTYFCQVRLATEEEKQRLFDAMREEGYKWNEKEKKIEKIKWRAKEGERYYFIPSYLCVESATEDYDSVDLIRYKRGNYFKTKEEAEYYLKKIDNIFKEKDNSL